MSIHKKIAMMIAPFLLVIGWVAADHWETQEEFRYTKNQMEGLESCNLQVASCELVFAQLKLQLQAQDVEGGRVYRFVSNYEMDDVLSAVVGSNGHEVKLPMVAKEDNYHWLVFFEQEALLTSSRKFRFAGVNSSGRFFGEVTD